MAPRSISSPLLLLSAVLLSCCCGLSGAARPAPSAAAVGNVSFIRSWCAGTEYPTLCDATLFPHAAAVGTSPARLAWAALNVTLDGARNAKAAMKEMAAGGQLTPVAAEAAGDCVSMLGDAVGMLRQSVDLLREILLRVDSLADLVRAACTCREWREAVVSSPLFRRQFIKRNLAPLLGFFFDPSSPDVPAIPTFAPARWNDPLLVAALLRSDFLLTNLQRCPLAVEPSWFVLDARGGYLLLINYDEGSRGLLALLNPLAQPHQRFFDVDKVRIFDGDDDDDNHVRRILRAGVILDDEQPERFVIFCLASQGAFRLRAAIFSSAGADGMDGGLNLSSWLEVPPPHPNQVDPEGRWLWLEKESGMRAGNFIYWPYRRAYMYSRQHLVVLDPTDPATPRLFLETIDFPDGLDPADFGRYIIGETHGGTMSIAYTNGLSIALMVRLEDGQEAGTWAPVSQFDLANELFDMLEQFPDDGLELVTMRGSILYYTTSQMFHPRLRTLAGSHPCAWKQGKWTSCLQERMMLSSNHTTIWCGQVFMRQP